MQTIDYILLAAFALVVIGVATWLVKRKKSGKGGCGCGCQGCPSAGSCHAKEEKKNETV